LEYISYILPLNIAGHYIKGGYVASASLDCMAVVLVLINDCKQLLWHWDSRFESSSRQGYMFAIFCVAMGRFPVQGDTFRS